MRSVASSSAVTPNVGLDVSVSPADPLPFVLRLDRVIRDLLPDLVVGTYVHGSVALGGFVAGKSDVDVLFVVADSPGAIDARELGATLSRAAEPCTGRGIEASVVTSAHAKSSLPSSNFVVHFTTAPEDHKIIDGTGHPGDSDLPMHYAVTRKHGVTVSGPAPIDVFSMPTRTWIVNYLIDDLTESLDGPLAYAVLNACRAWQYIETDELVSKVEGGRWAHLRLADGTIVTRALAQHLGEAPPTAADATTRTFVSAVLQQLASL